MRTNLVILFACIAAAVANPFNITDVPCESGGCCNLLFKRVLYALLHPPNRPQRSARSTFFALTFCVCPNRTAGSPCIFSSHPCFESHAVCDGIHAKCQRVFKVLRLPLLFSWLCLSLLVLARCSCFFSSSSSLALLG